jgi:hypothetical protein
MLHIRQVHPNLPVLERSDSMSDKLNDWEISEDYYANQENDKKMSLEDFILDSDMDHGELLSPNPTDELLKKTIEDVRQVLALASEGKNIKEIAVFTGLEEAYVYNIQVCAQGFHEDDEIAVAHLVLG